MKFHDIEQNTEEWLTLRSGKITGSGISKVMANYGKSFGDPAKKYASKIVVERMTGRYISDGFGNDHTERGHEQEPLARAAYESQYFCNVGNGGFFELDGVGCSPDGLVNDNGLVEIKSVIHSTHYANIKRQTFDPSYKWQLISNLKFTGRDWIDFISYCADFPEDKQLFVVRLNKDDFREEFKMIDNRLEEFNRLIAETSNCLSGSQYFLKADKESK